jgi:hypothetical protein
VNQTCGRFSTCELQCEANAHTCRAAKKSTTSVPPSSQVELAAQDVDVASTSTVVQMAHEYHPSSTTPTLLPGTQQTIAGPSTNPPKGASAGPVVFSTPVAANHANLGSATTRRAKTFNLDTYKYHSLTDYMKHIRQYGTTDSYSTEPVRHSRLSRLVTG